MICCRALRFMTISLCSKEWLDVATTIWGSTTKPASARKLAQLVDGHSEVDGTLYVGYPVLGTPDGAFPFDALLLSPKRGLIAFDIVEAKDLGKFKNRQDDIYNKLRAKLLNYPALLNGRELLPKITVITYAPAAQPQSQPVAGYPVVNDGELIKLISELPIESPQVFLSAAAAIQALTNIRKGRRSRLQYTPNSRGERLQRLSDSIANLDSDQSAAVVETVDGVQRIRGLAGSGKTIVLALKVAYLHAQNPDWKIAVTFNTRSLKGQFERLINTFVIEQTNEEPNWSNIDIIHSWGSPSSAGMYYNFCCENNLLYRDFGSAKKTFGDEKHFSGACTEVIEACQDPKKTYDAILVDEAQDLPAAFLKLCYMMLREPKRLIYAYDELQSLTDTSMTGPEDLFGQGVDGRALVVFETPAPGRPRQDIILERCYRNSRPLLSTAHALGFGIYREPDGLIQIFEQNNLWLDVGYRVENGSLTDGEQVTLARTPETSPDFLETHSPIDDLIQFKCFSTHEEQDAWLVEQIFKNIKEEELMPEDILVINPDPLKTRKVVGQARSALFDLGINSSIAGVSNSPDVFFEQDVVTFTGIFRAKGNEAGMVYIINADDCFHSNYPNEMTLIRNRLFTAITRSKAWVRVAGVGERMKSLEQEFLRIKRNDFKLDFVYPTAKKKEELRIVNRDLSRAERGKVIRKVDDLAGILDALESGEIRPQDLPDAMRKRLKMMFSSNDT